MVFKNENQKHPLVCVLTLNWNTKDMTIECINSILQSDYPNFRVIVIDNGSTDGSAEVFKKEFGIQIEILETRENLGYARGMNFGLEYGSKFNPDYFFIMNNDTKLDNKAISEMVKTAQKYKNNCVVTGKVYFYDKPKTLQTVGYNFNKKTLKGKKIGDGEIDNGQYDKESERDMIDDIFMLLPVKIYREIGGYSFYFFMNYEQTDLVLSIQDAGYKAIYCPTAKLWHKVSHSTGGIGNPKMMYWDAKSLLIVHYLHSSFSRFLFFYISTLFIIIWGITKGVVGTIMKRTKNLKLRYALLVGFLSGTKWLFHKKEADSYNPFS